MLRAYVHNLKLKNAAIRMVFQYWVTYEAFYIEQHTAISNIQMSLRGA